MTIENLGAFVASLPDWSMLDGCFGGRISPTDIDGAVERNGRVLFLEHKAPPSTPLKRAQEILFEALAETGHTTIVFWSSGNNPREVKRLRVYSPTAGVITRDSADLNTLRDAAKWWYAQANSADKEAA
jgi:hypothetical protein